VIRIDRAALEAITPGAEALYRQAFEQPEQLEPFGVLASKLRAEHFLAQVLHETGGLRALVENLNYSAQRLTEVWPGRFPSLAEALPFAHNSRALANKSYGGRMGNSGANDGWRFIGRGLLQLTGRDNYQRVGAALGLDLVSFPAVVFDPDHGLQIAGEVWASAQCNIWADSDNLERITKAINGGLLGLAERGAWLKKARDNHVVN
jgi:putative chitinase